MRQSFALFTRSIVSLIGSIITTIAAMVFITLFAIAEVGHQGGPYLGILAFLIVPAVFVIGLVLIPLGIWLQQRKQQRSGGQAATAPVIDFNQPRTRNLAFLVAALTAVNVIIIAAGTYKGVEVMETTGFCGNACHSVMSPELTAYSRSPHSRVPCVECHIGAGASWFVKSKLSGSWQVISVALDLFPRPIGTPIHDLRPARETCEQCHWPTKFVGDRLRVKRHFDEDEKQTEKTTVELLKVGGVEKGEGKGIHWHVDPGNRIRYRSDATRQHVYELELTGKDGATVTYKAQEPPKMGEALEPWRAMDCVDCHNRPTHVYRLPKDEIDLALADGTLDKSIPFIKREGLRVLQASYASQQEAKAGLRQGLLDFYQKQYPDLVKADPAKLDAAAQALWAIYSSNVFPQMKITWGTYPNFAYQHTGCFRCHGELQESGGKTISRSCSLCHEMLATEEENPEIIEELYP